MYCKLFASLYQGTLRGKSDEILVFTNLLAHCSKEGTVDKHFRAIAEETGLPIERVKTAIEVLESPDPESRSPEEDGARIVRLDEHRVWGWQVVNYGKYRAIRSEDDRAEQNRQAQQRWRERNKSKPSSAESKQDKPKEREREEATRKKSERADLDSWIEKIRDAYPRKGEQQDCRHAIRTALDAAHQTPQQILDDVLACAVWVKQAEDKGTCSWVPCAGAFFGKRQWTDPKKFEGIAIRVKEAQNGNQTHQQSNHSGDLNRPGRYAKKPATA